MASTRFYVGTPDHFSTLAFHSRLGDFRSGEWQDIGNGDIACCFRLPSLPTSGGMLNLGRTLVVSTRLGDGPADPARFFDVPSALMKADGKPMLLFVDNLGYDMFTLCIGETELSTSNGSCWDADAGDWDDEALTDQDGGVLDAYGELRAARASYQTRVSMIKDGWRLPSAASRAARSRTVGRKRVRDQGAVTNVMRVAREAERASQLAAKAAADAGLAAAKVTAVARQAVIDLTGDDE